MNREPNRNSIPNPGRYDMYAAFRTKERAEERERKRRFANGTAPSVQNRQRPGAQNTRVQGVQAQNARVQGTHTRSAGEVYHINRTPTPQRRTPPPAAQRRQGPLQRAPQYGTRIRSGTNGYRYGHHSSYRTSDGRILDGFDEMLRPIYRDGGAASDTGAVVTRASAAPDAHRLHPTRKIRIETMTDTQKKPFPFLMVFMVFLCTALVMGVLYTYMKLNEYTGELSTLTYRVTSLRNEANALSAEVVRREDLIAIEQTAADILGMVKNDILPKHYVSIENEDKTELVQKKKEEERKRYSVEIDLGTGKPIRPEDSGK